MGYLKLLTMENFKSWRGRQSVGPFMRFTCVIGPNGSGKSNLMDALSFVMGERTANLRVKNIQELIHGAHVGKPVSSVASVKMVYCEENGKEKTFARIIQGSSSEFLFNDKPVSQSVYTAELEKIGIIVKARNCLVFQGEVESIAMKKPKERTQLFEQISNSRGLTEEYEKKKKKMQQADQDTQFNFNQKKNAAAERKHAKLENEEAERYQMLLGELKENRIQLQLFQLYHNEKKIEFLQNKLDEKNTEIRSKKDSLSNAEDTFKAKKKVCGILNRDQQSIEKKMKTVEASLSQKRPRYIKAKENTSHQIKKVDMAKKCLKDNEKQYGAQKQGIQEMEIELADIETAWATFKKKVEEEMVQRGTDIELEESQLDRYKQLKELVRKKVATLMQQLEKLQWEQKADQEKMALDQRKQKEIEESIKQVEEQIEDHKKRIEKLEEYTKACTDSLTEKRKQEETLTAEIENSRIRMAEVNEELNKLYDELQNARIDYHEGKRQQMRAEILESLKRLYPDSVFGRLLDLCHPIHKKYQLAVTKVFGSYMNAIVVTTEKIARNCIRFLKEERVEPETFLALDYLDIKPINEKLRELKGSKMMIDVVQTPLASLKKVLQFVCGNSLVCETIKEAKQIAFDGPLRLKTVALDGTLFLKSGVISGGSSDLRFKARRWDEKDINKMKEKRDNLANELKELMKIRRKETDLKQLQAQCQGTQTRLKYSQSELEILKKKQLANFYKEKSKLESELVNIKSECAMLNEGLAQRVRKMEEFQKKINEVEDSIFQEFCEEIGVENIRVYEQEHVKQQEEIDRKRLEFENQKTRLSIQLEFSRGQLQKQINKISALKEAVHKDEAEIVNLKKDEEKCLLMVNEVQDLRIDLLWGSLDEVSEIELGSEIESTQMTADIYEREGAIQIDYSGLAEDLKDLQSDGEIEAHLKQLQQQAASKENILLRTAAPNLRALNKLQIVKDKFQESVDAFEASRKEARLCRHGFEQVKKRRYELFRKCFEHVSVAIDQIYKKLCRNSSAQAFLCPENPEEPYLGGISYNCVAPGKRFMPMDNLSGGEKTMAALALMFAIHSFCPAPFLILDEVDAALDNTNIGKVSSFIKEQAQEQFQMIVISLKEEFYSRADALIGVCPEQDDFMFSRVFTLDLTAYSDTEDNERRKKQRQSSTLD
ncbi:structural maintenance of chromosomes protein 1A isoform B [Alligator mississippiensis]|uniref:Structural maintenance of chromosomes protein 1A isoform B n=1 Tax=Alligator mississippiensis TaxID=8496 RepID=A0A151P6Z5_ALLMI|nr:structural maintenance of chromosomes protein 1A isoform B [Alligator mississippiensis]